MFKKLNDFFSIESKEYNRLIGEYKVSKLSYIHSISIFNFDLSSIGWK